MSLSDFLAEFEKENQTAFSMVQQTIEDLEQNCNRRIRKCSLETSMEEKAVKFPVFRTESSSSIDRNACASKTTAASSNCFDLAPEDTPIGKNNSF